MPQQMTGAELKTIRESLLLSAQALADLLKHAGLLSAGNVRTVQRWEDGARGIPADIAEAVERLDQSVEASAQKILGQIRAGGPTVLVRFDSEEDWQRFQRSPAPHENRLHAAALQRVRRDSAILGRPVRLVTMEFERFEEWRFKNGRENDSESCSAWAELQIQNEPTSDIDQPLLEFHLRPIRSESIKFHNGLTTLETIKTLARQSSRHIADLHKSNAQAALKAFIGKLALDVDLTHESQPKVREALGRACEQVLVCLKELQRNGTVE